jgi:nucleoside-diphosphate-sugar epimerase
MKILVTGATGFVGNHLISALLLQNHKIVASSTNKETATAYEWFTEVEYVEYNIEDRKDVNLFQFFGEPDVLIHLAWQGLPNFKSLHHIENVLFDQMYFIKNLVSNGLKSLTAAGTCLEYGMSGGSLQEDHPCEPRTAYGIAKDSLRKYVQLLNDKYEFSFKWVRFFYMYGPGQHSGSLIPQLETALKNNLDTFKMSGGEQVRDYLEIGDVVRNVVHIALQYKVTGIINCCSGIPISVKAFVESYLHRKGKIIKLELGIYPYPDYEPMGFWGDTTKLKKALSEL